MNIYVGNLPFSMTRDELEQLFAGYGKVDRATVVIDRESKRSKGFGFVEMSDETAAGKALKALDGQEINGRPLRVNEARPRDDSRRKPESVV